MSTMQNVAVVGASGTLGVPVVRALQSAGFNVTAVTRETSTATFPPGVRVKRVNYESGDSLRSALEGQDAVVSTTGSAAVGIQTCIVDAALAVGVKRFIPSEFGFNTQTIDDKMLKPMLHKKISTLKYIAEKSKEQPSFTWTGITTGLFFDWGLQVGGLGFDKAARTLTMVDSGDKRVSFSTLSFIANAVAAVLAQPHKTANRYLAVASFSTTQKQLLQMAQQVSGEEWQVERVRAADVAEAGRERMAAGDRRGFVQLLWAYCYGDASDNKADDSANALLGLEHEEPRPMVEAWLKA